MLHILQILGAGGDRVEIADDEKQEDAKPITQAGRKYNSGVNQNNGHSDAIASEGHHRNRQDNCCCRL